ncbi:diaminopimelate epimerase [Lacibacter luteus]|uniref:Diaminopimelate epimerase n=1 Tax=Lacibacter luteus TaxID=2508719 RepID=A0A4Q1CMD5_9BACT|nr:diaminopimelate epimerase [Lacibacter luteus]RXK62218.1 diaminopimelate epimerase [Lacibacter luteus]
MTIPFYKYQGTGNDFVIIDNRNGNFTQLSTVEIAFLCDRRFGIGADGLMLLQLKDGYDFEMVYYNADGNEGSMCGNGGRCLVAFAKHLGVIDKNAEFLATDGFHEAKVLDNGWIELKMKDVNNIEKSPEYSILNTGSPHYIKWENDIAKTAVFDEGKRIRYSPPFFQEGINVNFVQLLNDTLNVRTYERGVENETLSCGTGVTAAAIAASNDSIGFQERKILTPGGELKVKFEKKSESSFENIWLCGPAKLVFAGTITL